MNTTEAVEEAFTRNKCGNEMIHRTIEIKHAPLNSVMTLMTASPLPPDRQVPQTPLLGLLLHKTLETALSIALQIYVCSLVVTNFRSSTSRLLHRMLSWFLHSLGKSPTRPCSMISTK